MISIGTFSYKIGQTGQTGIWLLYRLFIVKISVDIAGRHKSLPKSFLFQSLFTPHFDALSRILLVFADFVDNIPEKFRKCYTGGPVFTPKAALFPLFSISYLPDRVKLEHIKSTSRRLFRRVQIHAYFTKNGPKYKDNNTAAER
jgi:hypothetical protein